MPSLRSAGGPISELSIAPPLTLDNDDGRWKLNGVDADGKECSCIAKRARTTASSSRAGAGEGHHLCGGVITSEKRGLAVGVALNLFF